MKLVSSERYAVRLANVNTMKSVSLALHEIFDGQITNNKENISSLTIFGWKPKMIAIYCVSYHDHHVVECN